MPFTKNFLLSAYFRTDDLEKQKNMLIYITVNGNLRFVKKQAAKAFFDLFEKAKDDAETLLIKWQSGANGEEITNNLSF